MANVELASNLKKLTKTAKKEYAHPSQQMYTDWINCINDSKPIIRRHGLIPELNNKSALKEMFPPLSTIADHFQAKDKTKTKQACNDVAQHFFFFQESSTSWNSI